MRWTVFGVRAGAVGDKPPYNVPGAEYDSRYTYGPEGLTALDMARRVRDELARGWPDQEFLITHTVMRSDAS